MRVDFKRLEKNQELPHPPSPVDDHMSGLRPKPNKPFLPGMLYRHSGFFFRW
jgi:hypothetical protein